MQMIMVAIANAVIGFIVGACGLSGFLLPMFYAAYTDFSVGGISCHKLLGVHTVGAGGSYRL